MDGQTLSIVSELTSKIEHVKVSAVVTDECCTVHYYLTGGVTVNHGRLTGASSERAEVAVGVYGYAAAAVTYSTTVAVPGIGFNLIKPTKFSTSYP